MNDEEPNRLSIGELAAATQMSAHTLRYYEDEGLIPRVERNSAGHRRYRPEHVRWIGLLDRLKVSGMSIGRMREYARLAERGDETKGRRARLLRRHRADLEARIAELQACRDIVRAKIQLYEGRLSDPTVVWDMVDEARRTRRGTQTDGLRSPRS